MEPAVGEFDGVGDEVDDDLDEAVLIAVDRREGRDRCRG